MQKHECLSFSRKDKKEDQSVSLKISMPDSLRMQFKSACALRKVTMNKAVLTLIKDWLDEPEGDSPSRKSIDF